MLPNLHTPLVRASIQRTALFVTLFVATAFARSSAQSEQGRFVSVRGADTVAREEFTRTPTSLVGSVTRSNGNVTKYEAHLKPNAAVDRIAVTVEGRGGVISVQMWQKGDMVLVRQETDTTVVPASDVIPTLGPAYALYEQALRHSIVVGGTSPTVHWIRVLQTPSIIDAVVTRSAADSVTMTVDKQVLRFTVDKDGRLLSAANAANTLRVVRLK